MIAKKKVDGGQGAAVVGLDAGDHLVFGMISKKKAIVLTNLVTKLPT